MIRNLQELYTPTDLSEDFNSRLGTRTNDISIIKEDTAFMNKLKLSWKYLYTAIEDYQFTLESLEDVFICKYILELYIELVEDDSLRKNLLTEPFSLTEEYYEGLKFHQDTFKIFFNIVLREISFSSNTREAKQNTINSIIKLRNHIIQ